MTVRCKCLMLGPNGIKPVYKTKEAACADVALPDHLVLKPGEIKMVPLQIGFDIPNGYKIVMYPRSSLMIKYGIVQPTSIIDSDYSGMEVHAPLYNTSNKRIELPAGTRVAQIECVPVCDCTDWPHESNERTGGFGSTGSK